MGATHTHARQWFECITEFCSLDGIEVIYLDRIYVETMYREGAHVKYTAKIFRMGESLKAVNFIEIDNDMIDDYLDLIESPTF